MLAIAILFVGIFSRLLFHAPNFTPVIALALFGGVYLNKRYALAVPLALMIISDLLIGMHNIILFTWGSVVLITALGFWVRKNKNVPVVLGASLFSAVLFFIITNFGSWLVMYPHTAEGLRNCYVAAIPFFRNTTVSTLCYSAIIFGLYETIASRVKDTRLAKVLLSS